ncbi:hypothetical protein QJQ45_010599 [Haematococcus lacustris]|nr:hypothetical protein QJQ45_010599 [Haematococcus lacustris]
MAEVSMGRHKRVKQLVTFFSKLASTPGEAGVLTRCCEPVARCLGPAPPASQAQCTEAEQAAKPIQPTKGRGKGKGKAAKGCSAQPTSTTARQLCRPGLQCIIEHAVYRGEQVAPAGAVLVAKGKEYPEVGYKRLRDQPPKAQQQQQPAKAHRFNPSAPPVKHPLPSSGTVLLPFELDRSFQCVLGSLQVLCNDAELWGGNALQLVLRKLPSRASAAHLGPCSYTAAPVLPAKKDAHGKWTEKRFAIDYRQLTAATKPDIYGLPRPGEMFSALGDSCYFSKLDVRSGFFPLTCQRILGVATSFTSTTACPLAYAMHQLSFSGSWIAALLMLD